MKTSLLRWRRRRKRSCFVEPTGSLCSKRWSSCQLLIATQSAILIDHFDVEDIVTVNLRDGASTFERLNPEALITHRLPLRDALDGLTALRARAAVKVMYEL